MKKRILSIMLALCMVLSVMPMMSITASAAEAVSYRYPVYNKTDGNINPPTTKIATDREDSTNIASDIWAKRYVTITPPVYAITSATCTNGSVSADKQTATSGTEITISNTPNVGYVLDSYKASYQVFILTSIANGTVKVDKSWANYGDTVTLSNTPSTGYELDSYEVYKNGDETTTVTVTDGQFTMPAYDVVVSATFKLADYTIAIATDIEHGSISADYSTARYSDYITVTSTPDAGYTLDKLYVNDNESYGHFNMPAQNITISATFKKADFSIWISLSIANGTVTADKQYATYGDTVTLSNNPATGYVLDSYKVYKNGDETTTVTVTDGKFTMPAFDVIVSATFKLVDYTVTAATSIEHGSISVDKSAACYGDTITVTITPDTCYVLDKLYVNGKESSPSFKMPAENVVITATFKECYSEVVVSVIITNGTVEVDKPMAGRGEIVTITATPATGYRLDKIYVNGEEISGNTFEMPAVSVIVSADFVPAEYAITVDSNIANGSISVSENTAVYQSQVQVTVNPAPGYVLRKIIVNGTSYSQPTFAMPGEAVTISAVFALANYECNGEEYYSIRDALGVEQKSETAENPTIIKMLRDFKEPSDSDEYSLSVIVGSGRYVVLDLNSCKLDLSKNTFRISGKLDIIDSTFGKTQITRYFTDEYCEHGVKLGEKCLKCGYCEHHILYDCTCAFCKEITEGNIVSGTDVATADGLYETCDTEFNTAGKIENMDYLKVTGGVICSSSGLAVVSADSFFSVNNGECNFYHVNLAGMCPDAYRMLKTNYSFVSMTDVRICGIKNNRLFDISEKSEVVFNGVTIDNNRTNDSFIQVDYDCKLILNNTIIRNNTEEAYNISEIEEAVLCEGKIVVGGGTVIYDNYSVSWAPTYQRVPIALEIVYNQSYAEQIDTMLLELGKGVGINGADLPTSSMKIQVSLDGNSPGNVFTSVADSAMYAKYFYSTDLHYYAKAITDTSDANYGRYCLTNRILEQPSEKNGYTFKLYTNDLTNPIISYQWAKSAGAPLAWNDTDCKHVLDALFGTSFGATASDDGVDIWSSYENGFNGFVYTGTEMDANAYVTFTCYNELRIVLGTLIKKDGYNYTVEPTVLDASMELGDELIGAKIFLIQFEESSVVGDDKWDFTMHNVVIHNESVSDLAGENSKSLEVGELNDNYTCTAYVNGTKFVSDVVTFTNDFPAQLYASLTLKENIDIIFEMSGLEDFDVSKLAIYVENTRYTYTEKNMLDATTFKCLLKSIAPNNIGEVWHVIVEYNGKIVREFDYSILSYCDAVYSHKDFGAESKLGKLCTALLNYGKWAEDYYNEVNKISAAESMVNSGHEIDFSVSNFFGSFTPPATGFTASTTVSHADAYLELGSKITLNFNVYTGTTLTKDNICILNNDGQKVDPDNITVTAINSAANGSGFNIKIANIGASKLSRIYTLTINGVPESTFKIVYGVESYCYNVQSLTGAAYTATLKTLCKAIYNYAEAAKAYATK